MSEPFIAEIRIFPYNFAPRGWAFCDGQLLQVSQNTALFSLIGTTYGGDGRTTVGLPNLQGRAPMHPGRGPGLTDRRLGQGLGTEDVTLSEAQIPNHNHDWRVADELGNQLSPANHALAQSPTNRGGFLLYRPNNGDTADMASETAAATGGGQPHDNGQPALVLNFCIALQGLYPSRS